MPQDARAPRIVTMMLTYRILYIYSHPVAFVQINPFEVDGTSQVFLGNRILLLDTTIRTYLCNGGLQDSLNLPVQ
jgi:hypothetical protein